MDKYVVMLDPYTSSNRICDELIANQIKLIAVLSDRLTIPDAAFKIRFPHTKFSEIFYLNNDNYDEIINSLKKLNVSYVLSGCELTNDIADKIANQLCPWHANDLSSSFMRMDKFAMQEAIKKANLRSVIQLKTSKKYLTQAEQKYITESIGFPLIVKPACANGTFSVYYCNSIAEIENILKEVIDKYYPRYGTTVKELVIQECLRGEEYFVDTVSYNGHHITVSIEKYYKSEYKGRPLYRYSELVGLRSDEAKIAEEYVHKVLSAVKLEHGLCHTEIFMDNGQPCLVEVNPRVSGCFGYPNKIAKTAYGYDQASILAKVLTTPEAVLEFENELDSKVNARVIILQNWQHNKIMGEFKASKISVLPSYREHIMLKEPGTNLVEANELGDAVAFILLMHNQKEQIETDSKVVFDYENSGILF